ncbi:MAG: type II secretion system F family protein, partial [Chlamydiota bacterium]|nr:type II secretion system F family protein [Chlamydiota bacterium]
MPKFQYSATDSRGKHITGEIESDNTVSAINILRGKGYTPISVTSATQGKREDKSFVNRTSMKKEKTESLVAKLNKIMIGGVSQKLLTIFSRQLAVLIDAGLPLLRSLHVLQEGEKNKALKDSIGKLSESVEGGSTFSEALSRQPKIYDKLFINMVRAGEIGGVLDEILNRLAEFMEKIQRLKSRVKAAMIYPTLVLVFAGGILSFLVGVIIPKFADIFMEMDIDLPTMTAVLIDFSNFAKTRWYIFILLIALMIISLRMMVKNDRGRLIYDRVKLGIPIFGILFRKVAIARFSRTLGTL